MSLSNPTTPVAASRTGIDLPKSAFGYDVSSNRQRSRSEDANILFAVPKKGRLHEEVMKLLNGAGLDAKRPDRLDVALCSELPVKLVFLPAKDIPQYVMDGNVDVGISGSDMLEEAMLEHGLFPDSQGGKEEEQPLQVLKKLGFGKCKLCVQAPSELCSLGPEQFVGKRIVTSFPALTKMYFNKLSKEGDKPTTIKVVSGSVEAAVGLGLADAIVDLVETGTTMRAAGLDVVADVCQTEAIIMMQRPTEENGLGGAKGQLVDLIMKRIEGFVTATKNVFLSFNVHNDNLEVCSKIAPGKRSPTVTKLQEDGWNAVSVMVSKKELHTTMDKLVAAGAVDLLCTALVNSRNI